MTGPLGEITALQYSVTIQRGKTERIAQRHSHVNIWKPHNAKFLRHILGPMRQVTEYVGILGFESWEQSTASCNDMRPGHKFCFHKLYEDNYNISNINSF